MNFWFSLSNIAITAKVSVDAWNKVRRIAAGKFKLGDVLSAMVMMADEIELERKLTDHLAKVDELPKSVQALLKDQDKLTPEIREMILGSLKE